jgi:hypothetical protein
MVNITASRKGTWGSVTFEADNKFDIEGIIEALLSFDKSKIEILAPVYTPYTGYVSPYTVANYTGNYYGSASDWHKRGDEWGYGAGWDYSGYGGWD